MSLIYESVRNQYGIGVRLQRQSLSDPCAVYYVALEEHSTARDVALNLVKQAKRNGFAFDEATLTAELEVLLQQPVPESDDPKRLDLMDGSCVITMEDLPEGFIEHIAREAHALNMTLNDYMVDEVLRPALERLEAGEAL